MSQSHEQGAATPDAQLELPLLGVPVRFQGNAAALAVAARTFARWRTLPPQLVAPGPPALVELAVGPPAGPDLPGEALLRCHGDTMLAALGASLMTAQLAAGRALAVVTPELAADEPRLGREVIERLGLLMTVGRDRTPLRAAAVVRDGRAALLVADDAAETATLCYACLRAGFGLLADTTVYVSTAGRPRLWGHAGLLPAELRKASPQLVGRVLKQDEQAAAAQSALYAEATAICLVERGAGQASQATRLAFHAAAAALLAAQDARFTLLRERAAAVAAALGAHDSYSFSLGSDLESAAALVSHLLR